MTRSKSLALLLPILAVLLGGASTLAFAPFDYKPLLVLGYGGLIALGMAAQSSAQAFRWGWLFGAAHFGSGIYWTYISTHIYGGAPAWLGLLLTTVLNAYLALYPALALALCRKLVPQPDGRWLIAAPAAFTLAELLRGWVFTGFPWLAPGYVGLDTPVDPLAAAFGVYVLGAIAVLLGTAGVLLVKQRGKGWGAYAALAVVVLAAVAAPNPLGYTKDSGAPLSTVILQGQGEVLMNQKWQPEARNTLITRFRDMTLNARGKQLVVWPEGPLPATYAALAPYYLAELDQALKASGSALFVGVLKEQFEGQDPTKGLLNATVLMGAGKGEYHKRHLVPFGEFFPIPDWLRPLMQVLGTPYSDFAFGAEVQPHLLAQGQQIFPNICFEDVFPNEFRRNARGASVLLNQTNDSWFGAAVAPWQHLQIARMRALENGRWFIRATNSGVSAFIGPDGRVAKASGGTYEVAVLEGEVTPRSGETPYARWGDAPLWWGSALLLIGLGAAPLLRRKAG